MMCTFLGFVRCQPEAQVIKSCRHAKDVLFIVVVDHNRSIALGQGLRCHSRPPLSCVRSLAHTARLHLPKRYPTVVLYYKKWRNV